jgi:hypothetical protein
VANGVNARVAANKIALISSLSLQFCIHNYLLFIISIHINTHTTKCNNCTCTWVTLF